MTPKKVKPTVKVTQTNEETEDRRDYGRAGEHPEIIADRIMEEWNSRKPEGKGVREMIADAIRAERVAGGSPSASFVDCFYCTDKVLMNADYDKFFREECEGKPICVRCFYSQEAVIPKSGAGGSKEELTERLKNDPEVLEAIRKVSQPDASGLVEEVQEIINNIEGEPDVWITSHAMGKPITGLTKLKPVLEEALRRFQERDV